MDIFSAIMACLSTRAPHVYTGHPSVEQMLIVQFLRQSASGTALHTETRRAHLFQTDGSVHLLHKPIRTTEFDCLTIEARWHWCEQQWQRDRIARPIPVVRRSGALHIGGPGEILDWTLRFTAHHTVPMPRLLMREAA